MTIKSEDQMVSAPLPCAVFGLHGYTYLFRLFKIVVSSKRLVGFCGRSRYHCWVKTSRQETPNCVSKDSRFLQSRSVEAEGEHKREVMMVVMAVVVMVVAVAVAVVAVAIVDGGGDGGEDSSDL